MANATILYACTTDGLSILNKPGTLNEWLPPRMALSGQPVFAAWAEPGPPIRIVAVAASAPDTEAPGHIWLSENGGRDWESKLEAPITTLLGLSVVGGAAKLYVGMEGGGLAESIDGGLDWGILPGTETLTGSVRRMINVGEPDVFYIIADNPDASGVLLEGNPDEGRWRVLPLDGVNALSWDPETGDLYAATGEGVHMSADRGATWPVMPGAPQGCTEIVVIPGPAGANPSILVSTESTLLVSNDAGASWHDLAFPQPGISAFARDPERRDRLYAATSGGQVFESGNRGQTWQEITSSPQAPVTSLFVIRI